MFRFKYEFLILIQVISEELTLLFKVYTFVDVSFNFSVIRFAPFFYNNIFQLCFQIFLFAWSITSTLKTLKNIDEKQLVLLKIQLNKSLLLKPACLSWLLWAFFKFSVFLLHFSLSFSRSICLSLQSC